MFDNFETKIEWTIAIFQYIVSQQLQSDKTKKQNGGYWPKPKWQNYIWGPYDFIFFKQ